MSHPRLECCRIAKACRGLQLVDASGWGRMLPLGLRELRTLVHLATLRLRGSRVCDEAVQALCGTRHGADTTGLGPTEQRASAVLSLRCLDLGGNPLISDSGVGAVAAACPELQALYLGGFGDERHKIAASARSGCLVTDAGVEVLARSCRDLRIVSLVACTSLSTQSLCCIGKHLRRVEQVCTVFGCVFHLCIAMMNAHLVCTH